MTLSREAAIASLVAQGVPRAKAEALFPPPAIEVRRDERALEKAEQREVVKIYRALGCEVYVLSQPRPAKQSPGLPDLRVFCPRAGAHWDHETKRTVVGEDGLRPAQRDYLALADRCGLTVVVGDRRAAADHLVHLGLASWNPDGSLQPATPNDTILPP